MGASENAIEGVSAAHKVHGTLCAAAVFRPMFQLRWLALLLCPIAACASFDDSFHVTPFLREQITGDSWRACLAREYQVQTRIVLREGRNWAEASRFSAKGWAALRSEPVAPWGVTEFELTEGRRTALSGARSELDAALANRDRSPCWCGKSQAAFDGWLAASARLGADVDALQKNFADAAASCRNGDTGRVEGR